ncbi:TIGR00159 family protein [bacterium]|nr:TIGR00159 family protein [bacterium]
MNMLFFQEWWRTALDFAILFGIIYFLLLRVRGTRALQVLGGLVNLSLIFLLAYWLNLQTINTLRTYLITPLIVGAMMMMAPELRRALVEFRLVNFFNRYGSSAEAAVLREICRAAEILSQKRWGALIVIEREADLSGIVETGTRLEHEVKSELLTTIFTPNSPLHDGAVVISSNHIIAAACLLPQTERLDFSTSFGTRHRAAIGLSEQVDALVVVVSEETGIISLAVGGNSTRNLDAEGLEDVLQSIMEGEAEET